MPRILAWTRMRVVVGGRRFAEPRSGVGKTVVDHVSDEIVRRAVVGQPPFVARSHQVHPAETSQLMTSHRQGQAQRVSRVPDRQLVVRQSMHEGEADGVGQHLEDLHGLGKHGGHGQPAARRRNALSADHVGKVRVVASSHS